MLNNNAKSKAINILANSGRTVISVPENLIRFTYQTRFKEAINAINPNIKINLQTKQMLV